MSSISRPAADIIGIKFKMAGTMLGYELWDIVYSQLSTPELYRLKILSKSSKALQSAIISPLKVFMILGIYHIEGTKINIGSDTHSHYFFEAPSPVEQS